MRLPTPHELDVEARRLTPWQLHDGLWLKRDDLFAPLGPRGVNGSKLRQLCWLFDSRPSGARRVITAASALSPQHCMTAALAAIHGLPSHHVSAAEPSRHPSTAMALAFGATFERTKVGYNPALQSALKKLQTPEDFVVPYGITTEAANELRPFHEVGARQVTNIPDEVETLIVPFGSGNSLTSIICGLVWHAKKKLRTLVTIGIGPDRTEWVKNRLGRMGVDAHKLPFTWDNTVSLHKSGYASYGDRMPYTYCGVEMHPVYEGKIFKWMEETDFLKESSSCFRGNTGFWVVGSAPSMDGFTSPATGAQ